MRIRIGSVAMVAVVSLICALPAQTEQEINGAWVGPFGGAPMEVNGTLEEDAITLVIVMPPTASSPEITVILTGTVEGDGMSGKLDFDGIAEGTWSARRSE